MGKKLAISGHATRGKEVIKLLKMLGGENKFGYDGQAIMYSYYVSGNTILNDRLSIIEDDDFVIFNLEEFLEKYPFKVGDKVSLDNKLCSIIWMCWECNNIYYEVQGIDAMFTKKVTADELKPYKEEVNIKDNKLFGTVSNPVETKSYTVSLKNGKVIDNSIDASQFMQIGKTVAVCFNTENYENEVELQLGDYEIVVRDGKTYAVNKKPKYPTTYAECCEVLVGRKPNPYEISFDKMELCLVDLDNTQNIDFQNPYLSQLNSLFRLRMCRDTYWKIYGEETGLGKPWEPSWQKTEERKFCIIRRNDNVVTKWETKTIVRFLAFPTEEMRNAFFENFKDLIEQCKEIL